MKNKKKKVKLKIIDFALILCLTVFIVAGCALISDILDRAHASEEVSKVQEEYSPIAIVDNTDTNNSTNKTEAPKLTLEETFSALKDINSDTIAWIYASGTKLDFPVVKTGDNSYYLHHSFQKTYTDAGAIFMDYQNTSDFSDQNTIIYGHARLDGTMFSCLRSYRKQAFYKSNKVITIVTSSNVYYYQVFSVNALDAYYDYRSRSYGDQLSEFASKLQETSYINTGVKVKDSDRIITLSTCTDVIENGRLVVFAVLLNPDGQKVEDVSTLLR